MPETNITGPLWGYEQRSRRLGGLWPTSVTLATSPYWASVLGTTTNVTTQNVKTDSSGNIFVLGNYSPVSAQSTILVKYDPTGTILWQKGFSNPGSGTAPFGLDIDSSGNIYIAGWTEVSANVALFLMKLDSTGAIVWQRGLNDASVYDEALSVVVSGANVTVCGQSRQAPWQIQIAQWNTSTGNLNWQRKNYGGAATLTGSRGISADSSGNIYLTGYSDAGGSGATDIVVIKYNSSGVIQWQKVLIGGTGQGSSISVDSSSNVYVAAYSNQSGNYDAILAKYNSSGVLQWQRKLATASADYGRTVCFDSSSNVYISIQHGIYNTIAKYNPSGVLQWKNSLYSDTGYGEGASRIFVFGSFFYTALSPYYVTGGATNLLLTKLPTDGSISGTYAISSVGLNLSYGASTLTDSDGVLTDTTGSLSEAVSSLTAFTPSISTLAPAYTPQLVSIS